MRTVLDRLLDYVSFDTQSSEKSQTHPSTQTQFELARHLAEELAAIGMERIRITPQCYVMAELAATTGCENAPALGWIAHLDTSDAASGRDIKPRLVDYRGGVIELGSGHTLDPNIYPALDHLTGQQLVVTDGSTLLGADDKAGIAEIMTALETVITRRLPHGKLCVAFTPDEEIGEGTQFFDIKEFGADFAYTMDGGEVGGIEYNNFNAAQAELNFTGRSVHPGSAKNVMINALKLAMEFNAMLPSEESPEHTEGTQGFYHLTELSGSVGSARATYIIRDHDATNFERRKAKIEAVAAAINAKYGANSVKLAMKEQYRNMSEVIDRFPFLIEIAERATRQAGVEPHCDPIRGGTDGAMLSLRGLPCPNLGTGGGNYHGEDEFVSVQQMAEATEIIQNIIAEFSQR
ncbi:MAG: peptidase T [Victivallaceae bacterium]|nr:peptidase T [Victivallaceae bacterium]